MTRVCPAVRPYGRPAVCVKNLNIGLYSETNYATLIKVCVLSFTIWYQNWWPLTFLKVTGWLERKIQQLCISETINQNGTKFGVITHYCQPTILIPVFSMSVKKNKGSNSVLAFASKNFNVGLFSDAMGAMTLNLVGIYPGWTFTVLPKMIDLGAFSRSQACVKWKSWCICN